MPSEVDLLALRDGDKIIVSIALQCLGLSGKMLSVKLVSRWALGPFPTLCQARAHRVADLQAVLVVRIVGVQLASNAATRPFMAFAKNAVSTLLRMRSSLSIVLDAGLRDKRSRPPPEPMSEMRRYPERSGVIVSRIEFLQPLP